MMPWTLRYDGFDAQQEGLREALCALGNGYFVTRGAAAEVSARMTGTTPAPISLAATTASVPRSPGA